MGEKISSFPEKKQKRWFCFSEDTSILKSEQSVSPTFDNNRELSDEL
jgi:hypothetical protein